MRDRRRILSNLETLYRAAFDEAEAASDGERMSRLDFDFQRDQLVLEVLLDLRDALTGTADATAEGESLLDKAEKLRRITRLR